MIDGILPTTVALVAAILISLRWTAWYAFAASIAVIPTTLLLQTLLYRMVFTRRFDDFLRAVRGHHAVTQLFAANILAEATSNREFDRIAKDLFRDGQAHNLRSLVDGLAGGGLELSDEQYAVLLSLSAGLYPTELLATWDTKNVPLGVDEYSPYFNILRSVYEYLPQQRKVRVFIFEDGRDRSNKTRSRAWKDLMELHRSFHFSQVYWCYRRQFEGIRGGITKADQTLTDFVYFRTALGPLSDAWVIGQDGARNFVVSDPVKVGAGREVMEQLLAECQGQSLRIA